MNENITTIQKSTDEVAKLLGTAIQIDENDYLKIRNKLKAHILIIGKVISKCEDENLEIIDSYIEDTRVLLKSLKILSYDGYKISSGTSSSEDITATYQEELSLLINSE